MKHKYTISKDDDRDQLIIKEYAELDKEILTLVCEAAYEIDQVDASIEKGKTALIATLRTPNFYPAGAYADKLADTVIEYNRSGNPEPVEVVFDDTQLIPKDRVRIEPAEDVESDDSEIDDLIEDEFDEAYDGKAGIDNVNSSIKVVDPEYDDFDEES